MKKMTKKEYINFYSKITGHTKSFVERSLHEHGINGTLQFKAGVQTYSAWIREGYIYCQHFLHGDCQGGWYFTRDENPGVVWSLIDRDQEENIQQIIADRS